MEISYNAPAHTGLPFVQTQAAYYPPSGKTVCFVKDEPTGVLMGVVTGLDQIGVPVVSSIDMGSFWAWTVRYNASREKLLLLAVMEHGASPWHGRLVAAEIVVSGDTLSFGAVQSVSLGMLIEPNAPGDFLITPAGQIVVSFMSRHPWAGMAVVGAFTGGTLTVGTPVMFVSGETNGGLSADTRPALVYDPISGKVVIWYETRWADAEFFRVGQISGNSISFGAAAEINTGYKVRRSEMCLRDGKVVALVRGQWGFAYSVGTISGQSIAFSDPFALDWGDAETWPSPTFTHHLRHDPSSGYLCIIDNGYAAIFHPDTLENDVADIAELVDVTDVAHDQQNSRFSVALAGQVSWVSLTGGAVVVAVFWTNFHGQTEQIE